ncbi:MAG: hypothetical protein OXE84_02570 [Rhodobacteraceae bacterium]|nr:hypothetical protein [Paracoccaceae bacterium]MCY4196216.1 hypothetical protein [Paracoccaceae bacterium]
MVPNLGRAPQTVGPCRLIGDPGEGPGLALRVDLGHFETVHPKIDMGVVEQDIMDPAKAMGDLSFGVARQST